MVGLALGLVGVLAVFLAGSFFAYVGFSVPYEREITALKIEVARLQARGLPPRLLEVKHVRERRDGSWRWTHSAVLNPQGLGSVNPADMPDADLVVEALSLVGGGLRNFSRREMGDLMTRSQFNALREVLISRQYLGWHPSGKQQGVVWTDDGERLLQAARDEYAGGRGWAAG